MIDFSRFVKDVGEKLTKASYTWTEGKAVISCEGKDYVIGDYPEEIVKNAFEVKPDLAYFEEFNFGPDPVEV